MTSDAKIGLLLGLIFIFMIALILNGLPDFNKDKASNELTKNIVALDNNTPPIAAKEREISRQVIEPSVRYTRPLPQSLNEVQKLSAQGSLPVSTGEKQAVKLEKIRPPQPKSYVVVEGDSLASIAQKFYGPIEGNRKVNVDKIVAANQNNLKSPDEIYPGQKLVIPPLADSASAFVQDTTEQIINSPMLEAVTSIGQRHLPAGGSKEKGSLYTVVEGDNLWKIAEEKLGDGNRYTEIVSMNSDIIQNERYIEIGMRLKLPAR